MYYVIYTKQGLTPKDITVYANWIQTTKCIPIQTTLSQNPDASEPSITLHQSKEWCQMYGVMIE